MALLCDVDDDDIMYVAVEFLGIHNIIMSTIQNPYIEAGEGCRHSQGSGPCSYVVPAFGIQTP